MYIEAVPNRNSPPCILLRESYREQGKVKKRTLANLSKLPGHVIEGIKALLRQGTVVEDFTEAFDIVQSRAYGHVRAALGTAIKIGLDTLIDPHPSPERHRVLAMIVARVLDPGSKLATSRGLDGDAHLSALREALGLENVTAQHLYHAMDWLLERQDAIEQRLAKQHLQNGNLVLYDVTSTYFEGQTCSLADYGYSRDGKKGTLQIVFGLLCEAEGRPLAAQVFEGNTHDSKTVRQQIEKLRDRFQLERVVVVGDRGCLTTARLREDFQKVDGLDWISALRSTHIQKLARSSAQLQLGLFDERGFVELQSHEDFPGERLIACRNPLLAERRAIKREELLQDTEKELEKIVSATQRKRRPLRGEAKIGVRVGKLIQRSKVAKHFQIEISEDGFNYQRNEEKIAQEAALDGIYVIRTSVGKDHLTAEQSIRTYKRLSVVERAFRSCKTFQLQVRPIYHALPERVRAHIFLCMLSYYLEWHLRKKLAPLIFDDEEPQAGEAMRTSPVEPAKRSPKALKKAHTQKTDDGLPVHSLRTLLADLSDLRKERILPKVPNAETFEKITCPTLLQSRALNLLGLKI